LYRWGAETGPKLGIPGSLTSSLSVHLAYRIVKPKVFLPPWNLLGKEWTPPGKAKDSVLEQAITGSVFRLDSSAFPWQWSLSLLFYFSGILSTIRGSV